MFPFPKILLWIWDSGLPAHPCFSFFVNLIVFLLFFSRMNLDSVLYLSLPLYNSLRFYHLIILDRPTPCFFHCSEKFSSNRAFLRFSLNLFVTLSGSHSRSDVLSPIAIILCKDGWKMVDVGRLLVLHSNNLKCLQNMERLELSLGVPVFRKSATGSLLNFFRLCKIICRNAYFPFNIFVHK